MVNIYKERLNQNINDAYNNQTEGVKELLESAKKNLADQKLCSAYTANRDKVNSIYKINKIVSKKKENENELEKRINENFQKMNEKLEINSKNLDFIFETVAYNNDTIRDGVKDILINYSNVKNNETCQKILTEQQNTSRNLAKLQIETERKIMQNQINAQNKLLNSQHETNKKIAEANNSLERNLKLEQNRLKNEVIKLQEKIEENSNLQKQIINQVSLTSVPSNSQKVGNVAALNIETKLEAKIDNMKKQNDEALLRMKQEIVEAYKIQNRNDINNLLEERRKFLQELQEKDMQIRKLNYKLYEYEAKLEREMQKNQKNSLFSFLFKKEEIIEEPTSTSQILNYMY